jgi:hypothetical protein
MAKEIEASGEFSVAQKQERSALNDTETLEEVVSCLTEYIPISTQEICDQQTIFEILIRAVLFIEIV